MTVTTTTNKSLNKVTVGTESGTWGPYINGNQDILDTSFGGVATIPLTNSPVLLSSAQYQCVFIKLTGALTGNVALTFPGGIGSYYTIMNQTTNSSNFTVTMLTAAGGSATIGLPPGQNTKVLIDGTSPAFESLPPVGSLWHHVATAVPAWVNACTIPPFLYANGTTFSSATYPALSAYLGGTTLPDLRGRFAANFNDGTGRMTSGSGGVDGNTNLATGGVDGGSLSQANIPNYNLTVVDGGHVHAQAADTVYTGGTGNIANNFVGGAGTATRNTASAGVNIIVNSGGSGTPIPIMNPTQVVGLTMVRAG